MLIFNGGQGEKIYNNQKNKLKRITMNNEINNYGNFKKLIYINLGSVI